MSARNALHDNDSRFHGWASPFTAQEWSAPSLCDGWTNHEVLAHLVIGYSASIASFALPLVRHGSFDAANASMARTLAATRDPAALLDDFARYRDRPRGMGRYFPRRLLLGDHVTHELDICLALGKEPTVPAATLVTVLNTQVSLPNPFVPAFRNSRGLRLSATDADWSYGVAGPAVHGRAADLLSTLGNRPAALGRLDGDGVDLLAGRVRATTPNRTAG